MPPFHISFFQDFWKKSLKTLDITQNLCHNGNVVDVYRYVTSGSQTSHTIYPKSKTFRGPMFCKKT